MEKILFICTGNTCRSPLAQYLFNAKIDKTELAGQFYALSAGIYATDAPASKGAQAVMRKRKADLQHHRARRVVEEDIKHAKLVLCMSQSHTDILQSLYPAYRAKIHNFGAYIGNKKDVVDPYGAEQVVYEKTARQIEEYIDKLIEKLKGNKTR